MSVMNDIDTIIDYSHFWNWAPDWHVLKKIYESIPDSYSVLTPFAYSYLEELIRTTTSEYGLPLFDHNRKPVSVKVGISLIDLAIKENEDKQEYTAMLERIKHYYKYIAISVDENGRNNVLHGHLHPRFWSKESFETLLHDIAELSKYSKF